MSFYTPARVKLQRPLWRTWWLHFCSKIYINNAKFHNFENQHIYKSYSKTFTKTDLQFYINFCLQCVVWFSHNRFSTVHRCAVQHKLIKLWWDEENDWSAQKRVEERMYSRSFMKPFLLDKWKKNLNYCFIKIFHIFRTQNIFLNLILNVNVTNQKLFSKSRDAVNYGGVCAKIFLWFA